MDALSNVVVETQRRALSLLDFLEAFYRRRFPPVRDIAKHNDFLVRGQDLPAAPGVMLTGGGRRWLTLKLVAPPEAPRLPDDLLAYVDDDQVSAHVAPTIRADIEDEEERQIAAELLDAWITDIWQPWSDHWRSIERGRAFYKRAFDLRARVERDRDAIELVWGFGRLRWLPEESDAVDHPLLTVPIEIELDRADGILSLVPAGPVSVEYAFLADLAIADRAGYLDRRRSAEEIEIDPWSSESLRGEYEGLLRSVDLDGRFGEISGDRPNPHAMLDESWVLYLRRRQADYLGFLDAQRQVLMDAPESLPLPIASLVVDEPSKLVGAGPWGDTDDVELLLPLPANEEQHAILIKAAQRAGVTAQGPPGTGKSHTIANLISHFVAHGQRVLVVAEKEQAIAVLADKVPAGIRALVVSNLGSDAEARTRLEQSITSIQAGVFNVNTVPTIEELTRRQHAADDHSSRIALLSAELRDRSMVESTSCPASISAPGQTTPSEIAAWLADNEASLNYIPDQLSVDELCPVSPEELADLAAAVRDLDPVDLDESLRLLPPANLAMAASLAEADSERERLDVQLRGGQVLDWSTIDASGAPYLDGLSRQVDDLAAWCTKWSGTWLARVRDELSDADYFQTWTAFASTIRRDRELALQHGRSLLTHDVVIPDVLGDSATFRHALEQVRERLTAGKGLGVLRNRDARDAAARCRVDGVQPTTATAIQLCIDGLDLREARRRLASAWANQTQRVGAPPLGTATPEHEVGDPTRELETIIAWKTTRWPALLDALSQLGIAAPVALDEDTVGRLHQITALLPVRRRHQALVHASRELDEYLAQHAMTANAAALWRDLRTAKDGRDWAGWDRCLERVRWLHGIGERAERVAGIRDRLAQSAPVWVARIIDTKGEAAGDPGRIASAWRWRCCETWITSLSRRRSAADLQRTIEEANRQRLYAVEELVVGHAWRHLADTFTDRHRIALQQYVTASKRLGKGHSKYAMRFQREVRSALSDAKDAVPVWIMTIAKALESFRPAAEPPFDVLIVDEASQVGLGAIPILGLARRAIIVGDDKQTSPENVGLNREPVFELMEEHLREIPKFRTLFDPETSLYDLAAIKFPDIVMLREHFRCLPEIIAFSSERYYGGNIEALRDRRPAPGWSPTGTVNVRVGVRKSGLDVNENEARAAVDLIAELVNRPEYEDMTFGVISMLGAKQAPRIQELLLDRLGSSVVEDRRIRCGDASSFQGDERDVVVISLVAGPDESGQLGRIGAMTGKPAERRVNVAASRARNQLWIVHSIEPEDFPSGDPRAELIRHCREPAQLEVVVDRLLDKCESEFERRVVRDILARGYRHVRVQRVVGNYRIDIVVEGPESRLAVECDGDAWHGEERWDHDRARQTVLERSGWTFERISGSTYFRDPSHALEPLWAHLDELGIPTGDWAEAGPLPPPRRVVDEVPSLRTEFGIDEAQAEVEDEDEDAAVSDEPRVATTEITYGTGEPAVEAPNFNLATDVALRRTFEETEEHGVSASTSTVASHLLPPPLPRLANPSLRPYTEWQPFGLPLATRATTRQLVDALVDVVSAEGPIVARRAYLLCHQAAGGHRVGRDIRSEFIRATYVAVRDARLSQIRDSTPAQEDKTIYIPMSPHVVMRDLGPRDLYEVPPSEVLALVRHLNLDAAPLADVCRAVLSAYGLRKLTQKAEAFIQECREYLGEPA
jgi:very-short-patch-repair endonuclease